MKRTFSVPLGSTLRVKRDDGSYEIFIFRGSDAQGLHYDDMNGKRHHDIGVYVEISIKSDAGWTTL